jgi:hypothetical protein
MNSVSEPRTALASSLSSTSNSASDCGRALTLTLTSSFGACSLGRSERGAPGFLERQVLDVLPEHVDARLLGWICRRLRRAAVRACIGHGFSLKGQDFAPA